MPPAKGQSILIGALAYTVLSVLTTVLMAGGAGGMGAGLLACLIMFVASVVAVWHYTNTHRQTLTAGQGAGVGVAATVLGLLFAFGIGLLLQTLGITPSTEELMEMQRADMLERGMPEDQIDSAMAMGERFSSPLMALVFGIPMAAIAGAIGGAISSMIFKKGERAA
jgi:hypothetical protein